MGFFLEVLIGGLLAGVLYSLVALGFVLIFKASGVFNFAQGAMVLFAALALVRALELFEAWKWPFWLALIGAFLFAAAIMVGGRLADRAAGAAPAGEPGRHHPVHGHASASPSSSKASARRLFGTDVYPLDLGMPKEPMILFENAVRRRHPGQRARLWSRP